MDSQSWRGAAGSIVRKFSIFKIMVVDALSYTALFVCIIFAPLGLALFFWRLWRVKRTLETGNSVMGMITRHTWYRTHRISYRYSVDKQYDRGVSTLTSPHDLDPGNPVEVIYNPARPGSSYLPALFSTPLTFWETLFLIFLGVIFLWALVQIMAICFFLALVAYSLIAALLGLPVSSAIILLLF